MITTIIILAAIYLILSIIGGLLVWSMCRVASEADRERN